MAKRRGSGEDVDLGRTMEDKLLAAVVEQLSRAAGGGAGKLHARGLASRDLM